MTVSPSLFVAKDQARSVIESIGAKTIIYSQTNSSVGVMKKKKKEMEKIEVRPISVYNCNGVMRARTCTYVYRGLTSHTVRARESKNNLEVGNN